MPLYNPDNEDFSVTYDIHENGTPDTFTLKKDSVGFFVPVVAEHVKHHLAYKIAMKKECKPNYELAYKNAVDEIVVTEI